MEKYFIAALDLQELAIDPRLDYGLFNSPKDAIDTLTEIKPVHALPDGHTLQSIGDGDMLFIILPVTPYIKNNVLVEREYDVYFFTEYKNFRIAKVTSVIDLTLYDPEADIIDRLKRTIGATDIVAILYANTTITEEFTFDATR